MEPISSLQAEEARLRSKLANNPFFSSASNLFQFLRWMLISTLTGLVVGSVSTIFNFGLKFAVDFRHAHLWVVLFLPVAGLAIVFLYRFFHYENNAGTDTVINSIHKEAHIPLRMSFLIFVSTILTVLCGGSVGREGAAMQIGGSIGEQIGEKLRFNEKDKKIMLMSGISAAFSALFGTPMAAAFLAMEIASIGIMYYAALVPCIWASLTAYMLAKAFHAPFENLAISSDVTLNLGGSARVILLAVLCAFVSILFCKTMHVIKALYARFFPNPFVRAFTGGVIIILLSLLLRTDDYLGPGMNIIERALHGETAAFAFLLKILFTALTIGAGFKGGEIVPSFCNIRLSVCHSDRCKCSAMCRNRHGFCFLRRDKLPNHRAVDQLRAVRLRPRLLLPDRNRRQLHAFRILQPVPRTDDRIFEIRKQLCKPARRVRNANTL